MKTLDLFKVNKYVMASVGSWPIKFKSERTRLFYRLHGYVVDSCIVLTTFLMLVNVPITLMKDLQLGTQYMGLAGIYVMTLALAFILRSDAFQQVIYDIITNPEIEEYNDVEEIRSFFKDATHDVNFINLLVVILAVVNSIAYQVLTFDIRVNWKLEFSMNHSNGTQRPTPYGMWLPYEQEYYNIYCGFAVFVSILMIPYYSMSQLTYITLYYYIVTSIRVIKYRFRNLFDFEDGNPRSSLNLEEKFKEIIIAYDKILRFLKEFDDKMKYIFLVDILVMTVQLAFSIYQISSVKSVSGSIFQIFSIVITLLTVTINAWFASYIEEESIEVAQSIYESKWYEQDRTIKTLIQLYMIRTQKPITFSMGPFAKISAKLVITLVRTAISYATFLEKTN